MAKIDDSSLEHQLYGPGAKPLPDSVFKVKAKKAVAKKATKKGTA